MDPTPAFPHPHLLQIKDSHPTLNQVGPAQGAYNVLIKVRTVIPASAISKPTLTEVNLRLPLLKRHGRSPSNLMRS